GGWEYDRRARRLEALLAANRRDHARHWHGAIHAALEGAVDAAFILGTMHAEASRTAVAESLEPGDDRTAEHAEAPLLGLVEAAVERAGGIAELLESGAGFGERGSSPLHQLGRINPARVAAGARLCLGQALDTHAGELTGGLLESRPRLFLIGRERKTGLERGETRFTKGLPIFNRRPPAWTLR